MNNRWTVVLCDDLEKIRTHLAPRPLDRRTPLAGRLGQRISFQVAVRPPATAQDRPPGTPSVRVTTVAAHPVVHQVGMVPVQVPTWRDHDEEWIDDIPGLYPDVLLPVRPDELPSAGWNAYWVDLHLQEPGEHQVQVEVEVSGSPVAVEQVPLRVVDSIPRPSRVAHVEWFHADCLAEFYQDDMWSPGHWRAVDSFQAAAADMGVTGLLSPLWTPMLDIAPGRYRTTSQLLDLHEQDGHWEFGTTRLDRWVQGLKRHGFTHFEVPHLFTQWGAEATPRFVVDGEPRFGWGTPATDPSYRGFLEALVPFLRSYLDRAWGGPVLWHISDEPRPEHRAAYAAARSVVADLLVGARTVDALSDPSFLDLVDEPIVATDHVESFLAQGHPARWVYHCVSQCRAVANRFIAQPMTRHRALALHLHGHRAEGFLHWGFNFYRTQFGRRPVDPWQETAAGGAFLSGDAFVVYPGPGRQALPSLRHRALSAAWDDLALWEAVAEVHGDEATRRLLAEDIARGFHTPSPSPARLHHLRSHALTLVSATARPPSGTPSSRHRKSP
ncbi:protein of unknown function [Austwickia chelonae]|uniref:Glycoside hydrolase 123 catalytic domain-containing protein n=1 Tax=Austwickia chelonae NBRC 105200 TaxID=1184607 RepID=K6V6W6_9MICO|nr:DUF4091 domain-containing protein [Austwickia chelonae]GAB77968.1 hypothetical protein AUCHE_08_02110 [Austwickia chelonae NBRC 105200]SEV93293.1 protein of unknown function [Austwickia chelonae]